MSDDSVMKELYEIREKNSLRHINMSLEELQSEMKESREEFERLMAQKRAAASK